MTWSGLSTKYLLLPIHVSLSFIQTPTLASSLYLLLLRFLNRDYVDVQRLCSSAGTDSELTDEETAVMKSISNIHDGHPDAHAARLHLTLALLDAPWEVKAVIGWDVPGETYKYLNKISYVGMASRLDKDSEGTIITLALELMEKEDLIKKVKGHGKWRKRVIDALLVVLPLNTYIGLFQTFPLFLSPNHDRQ